MNRIARVPRKAQRGVILFVALIVLVAMWAVLSTPVKISPTAPSGSSRARLTIARGECCDAHIAALTCRHFR